MKGKSPTDGIPLLPVFPTGNSKTPSVISTLLVNVAAVVVCILSVEATPINPIHH